MHASGLKLCGEGIGTKSKFWRPIFLRSCGISCGMGEKTECG